MGSNDLEKLAFEKPQQCDACGGRLEYIGIGRYRCLVCKKELLDDYGKIKNYFEEHGPAPVMQIVKDTGISKEKVRILMKRGTAELISGNPLSLKCEKCGMPIRYGRYCTICSNHCFREKEAGQMCQNNKNEFSTVRKNFGNYTRNK